MAAQTDFSTVIVIGEKMVTKHFPDINKSIDIGSGHIDRH